MLPKYHIILSIIVAIILYFFNLDFLSIILFFLAALLIDIDHYILYITTKKSFNFSKAYKYFKYELGKKKLKKPKTLLLIFHTIEFFILLLVLSFFLPLFWPILFGGLFHEVVDLVHNSTIKDKKYIKAPSLILYIVKK